MPPTTASPTTGPCSRSSPGRSCWKKCGERIELQTSDTRRACTVLEGLGITQYKVVDRDTICIYERLHDGGAITMALAQAGVQTTGITVQNEALEDYYLNLTGGGRHA